MVTVLKVNEIATLKTYSYGQTIASGLKLLPNSKEIIEIIFVFYYT